MRGGDDEVDVTCLVIPYTPIYVYAYKFVGLHERHQLVQCSVMAAFKWHLHWAHISHVSLPHANARDYHPFDARSCSSPNVRSLHLACSHPLMQVCQEQRVYASDPHVWILSNDALVCNTELCHTIQGVCRHLHLYSVVCTFIRIILPTKRKHQHHATNSRYLAKPE
jgi:hypothetical protein